YFAFLFCFTTSGLAQSIPPDSLNTLAYQSYRNDVVLAKSYAIQALATSQKLALSEEEVKAWINLGRCYRQEGNWDSTFLVLEKAVELGEQYEYVEGLMNAQNNLAASYLTRGEIDVAVPHLKQSLFYAQKVNNSKGIANAYNNLAIIAESNLDYDSAFQYLNGALTVYQDIGDSSGIAQIYTNQAYLFEERNALDSAIAYNFKALRIQESQGISYLAARTYIQIGDLFEAQFDYQQALSQYQKAHPLFEQAGDVSGIAIAQTNLGNTLKRLERIDEALTYQLESLVNARKLGDRELVGIILVNTADVLLDIPNKKDTARLLFNEAVSYLEEAKNENLPIAYQRLGEIA
ncbi:MAG: tetratricopeptide repeat protein, partial [Bacteroidota bacterium]